MSFADAVIDYHFNLKPNWRLPKGFELIYPFGNDATRLVFKDFYLKYFDDHHQRRFLFGINPGRFGAGVTGVPFTDPYYLQEVCGIENDFSKRKELSAVFIYDIVEAMGGVEAFYSKFYISSICPLGFLKDGINANYYDDPLLQSRVRNKIINNISTQLTFGADRSVAFSLGKGKNFKFFKKLNDEFQFFEKIVALPHPRWVMQYQRKRKDEHLDTIVQLLSA